MDKKKSKNKRKIIWIILIIVVILIILFGARAYLYLRVLIGNDLIIKLEADKENIFLKHGESDKIKITSYAITNIFCETNCTSKFIDLSSGSILEEDNFNLKMSKMSFSYPIYFNGSNEKAFWSMLKNLTLYKSYFKVIDISKTKEFILNETELGSGLKIYRFDLQCNSIKTFLCETKAKTKKNSLLITMDYGPNDNEKLLKLSLESELSSLLTKIQYYNLLSDELESKISTLEKTIQINELKDRLNSNKEILLASNKLSENLLYYWNSEDYENLNTRFKAVNSSLSVHEKKFLSFNDSVYSNISAYNVMIENISELRSKLENLKKHNMTQNSTENLNYLIEEFNELTLKLSQKGSLIDKVGLLDSFGNKIQNFSYETSNNTIVSKNLSNLNLNKIFIDEINITNVNLPASTENCCINKICNKCCDNICYEENDKYPIILLHGHLFNEKVSAQASLDSFENIQRSLVQYGYLNAGSLLLSSSNDQTLGVWQKINVPMSIKTSYYFDILTNQGKSIVIQTKTDNLDTYTLRLKDIINEVKSKTNRKKVIIVAHSMGGLIARKYLSVFGESDVEKLILITTPNNGISKNTLALCPVFGTKLECSDMDKNSLFMNKLNNAQVPKIPIYNIIGTGCETNEEDGDGIVTNSSQYLEYATNYYITGTCSPQEFKYLHTEILDTQKYPEVSEILEKVLRDNSIKQDSGNIFDW